MFISEREIETISILCDHIMVTLATMSIIAFSKNYHAYQVHYLRAYVKETYFLSETGRQADTDKQKMAEDKNIFAI